MKTWLQESSLTLVVPLSIVAVMAWSLWRDWPYRQTISVYGEEKTAIVREESVSFGDGPGYTNIHREQGVIVATHGVFFPRRGGFQITRKASPAETRVWNQFYGN